MEQLEKKKDNDINVIWISRKILFAFEKDLENTSNVRI